MAKSRIGALTSQLRKAEAAEKRLKLKADKSKSLISVLYALLLSLSNLEVNSLSKERLEYA
jgi:hypothetical protein